jgi:FtsP/CotA-like multicopper oxidase with cupredoxin domain
MVASDVDSPRSLEEIVMLSRRSFLAYTGGTSLGLYVFNKVGIAEAVAAIPGGTLDPGTLPKFVTPVLQPPAMPTNGTSNTYEIEVRQFRQQLLPAGFPATTVWGYGPIVNGTPGLFNAPSLTIEAKRSTPVTVIWRNKLVDADGNYLPHLLPVDPTLHWANPGRVGGETDMRPNYDRRLYVATSSAAQAAQLDPVSQYTRYWGPVPCIPHVHGMNGVEAWSDGYAESWFLPSARNINGTDLFRTSYASAGRWYDYMKSQAGSVSGGWKPGQVTFRYPNTQRPSTAWYHDHAIGMTRLNVVAGPAGFWLIRSDDPADNPRSPTGAPAVLPTGAYEVPLAIQDRSFNADGSLFYPDTRAFFDQFTGPYIGSLIPGTGSYSDVSPIYNPEFFGNCIIVNGATWPFMNVEPRRYRLRVLNGCTSRALILRFSDAQADVWQIGNEGGYLRAAFQPKLILLAPAERADLIVDFSRMRVGATVTLLNDGPDAPFGGAGFRPADPQTTGQVMQFRVGPLTSVDATTPPEQMTMPDDLPNIPVFPPPANVLRRPLALLEMMAKPPLPAIPVETNLGVIGDAAAPLASVVAKKWDQPITENPAPGATEMWELYNFTADAHPIHIHEVLFQVVNRQRLDRATGVPVSTPVPPPAAENGFKDTVIAYPGEVTRVQMKFSGSGGRFVWHCHIVDHEDNEMMRPYQVGPADRKQPPERGM